MSTLTVPPMLSNQHTPYMVQGLLAIDLILSAASQKLVSNPQKLISLQLQYCTVRIAYGELISRAESCPLGTWAVHPENQKNWVHNTLRYLKEYAPSVLKNLEGLAPDCIEPTAIPLVLEALHGGISNATCLCQYFCDLDPIKDEDDDSDDDDE